MSRLKDIGMSWSLDRAWWRGKRAPLLAAASVITAIVIAIAVAVRDERSERETRAAELTGGDPHAGRQAIATYGCGSCHTVPGVSRAHGMVGPPLTAFGKRIFVAGRLPNTPDNLIHWIINPPDVSPSTAMPVTGVTEEDARDIAAYLYTLR
jgi:cytochrome c2